MPAQYAPQKALHILERLLVGGEPLAPPLPAHWENATDFYGRGGDAPGIFADWVNAAMAAPYI